MTEPHAALDLYGIAWRLGATLFFVLLNGFFVAAEFALVKVRASRIEALAEGGSRAAQSVHHILTHLDRYLSACQLGITLASLILGALGEPAVSVIVTAILAGFGVDVSPEVVWVRVLSLGIAFGVITLLHMTVGEQAPKMWALRRAEGTAIRTAPVLRVFTFMFRPFIAAVNSISNAMLRLAGLPSDHGHESQHSAEEIRSILNLSARAGAISEREHEITRNVFRLVELEVRHIAVPRVEIAYLSLEHSAEDNVQRIRELGHSRVPLCEQGLDSVVGIVHMKDVLLASPSGSPPDLRALAREPVYVSDTMALSDFLLELQARRRHCAVAVDEHGTTIGLAFREDALEEIVGPLGDEFDETERPSLVERPDGTVEVSGRLPLPTLSERVELDLPEADWEGEDTVSGLVTARLGRLARVGDEVSVGAYIATVTDVYRRRVRSVTLRPIESPAPGKAEPEGEADA